MLSRSASGARRRTICCAEPHEPEQSQGQCSARASEPARLAEHADARRGRARRSKDRPCCYCGWGIGGPICGSCPMEVVHCDRRRAGLDDRLRHPDATPVSAPKAEGRTSSISHQPFPRSVDGVRPPLRTGQAGRFGSSLAHLALDALPSAPKYQPEIRARITTIARTRSWLPFAQPGCR